MVELSVQHEARFKVLLTQDRPQAPEHWSRQLPRLLEPMGIAAYVVRSGREAVELAGRTQLHAAVVDLGVPMSLEEKAPRGTAGLWLLELLRRLPNRPPVVVLRSPAYSRHQAERLLAEVLRLGAFSVLNKPVEVEQLLAVFRRLMDRQYHGTWPGPNPPGPQRYPTNNQG